MGFYNSDSNLPNGGKGDERSGGYGGNSGDGRNRGYGKGRWLAVVAVSALVGSGATLGLMPMVQSKGVLSTSFSPSGVVDAATAPVSSPVNLKVTDGITSVAKKVEPAVMGVVNYAQVSDFFSQQTKLQATGVGTGVLFYKDKQFGYIVTNNHVVEGAAKVEVVFESGKHLRAAVVGTDLFTDLAVLKVPVSAIRNIAPVQFANSDQIQVGEPAIAIGTPMGLDFADSVTAGIVSAKKRVMPVEEPETHQILDYQAVIQTDAAINPGNSGGPLLNIGGQVIGINSSKIAAPAFEGMGFAIPSNEVQNIAQQIMQTSHAVHPSLGIQGYSLAALPEEMWPNVPVDYGVWVKAIMSPQTKQAGLDDQDVIVGIDGHDVRTMADLRTHLFQVKPGQVVTLRIYRGNQQRTIKVKVGTMESANTANMGASSSGASAGDTGSGSDSSSDPFSFFP